MKTRFALIVVAALSALSLYGRELTVVYYPHSSETEQLTIAFSPDGTYSQPNSNPTLYVKPNTKVVIPLPQNTRLWIWVPASGWLPMADSNDPHYNDDVVVVSQTSTGSLRFIYYTPPKQ